MGRRKGGSATLTCLRTRASELRRTRISPAGRNRVQRSTQLRRILLDPSSLHYGSIRSPTRRVSFTCHQWGVAGIALFLVEPTA